MLPNVPEPIYPSPTVKQYGPFNADSVADLIIESRIEQGVSQGELARRIGSHQSMIAKLERGTNRPTITTLERIANALGMQVQISFRAAPPSRRVPWRLSSRAIRASFSGTKGWQIGGS